MRISDWSSDVCSSDLRTRRGRRPLRPPRAAAVPGQSRRGLTPSDQSKDFTMLYDLTVPAYQNGLKALSGELSKASAWGADNGIGELQLAVARLAPDNFQRSAPVRFTFITALNPPPHPWGASSTS